jgi:predicted phosphodiesterase
LQGDNHYPFNNPKVEKEFFEFLKEERPDYFVHCGDLLDFHEISYFRRVPKVPYSLKEEIEMGKEFLEKVRKFIAENNNFLCRRESRIQMEKISHRLCFCFL